METRIYNDVALHGALVMSKNESGFPENPQVGTIIVKDYCLYAYIRIGGMETWYPFANKTNSYVHVQGEAALTWTVVHNLGTADVWIQVKDEFGNIVQVGKTTIDKNSFTLNFTQATKGTVVVVAPDTIDVPGVKATSINVANGSVVIDNSGVRVNGSYVLTSANIETQINNAVAVETSARIAADANLQSSIDIEVTARRAADGDLTSHTTANRSNLVSAINEVKSGAVGKTDNNLPLTNGGISSAVLETSNTTPNQVADSISASAARSVKYLVQVTSGTSYQVCELLLVHNSTTVSMTQYATITTGSELASFDADISSGSIRLLVTPVNALTTFKVVRTSVLA